MPERMPPPATVSTSDQRRSGQGAHEWTARSEPRMPPPPPGEVLIVIPAYNEELSLPDTLAEVRRECPWADVVVINDGSADDTARISKSFGYPVLSLAFNLGIGGAV